MKFHCDFDEAFVEIECSSPFLPYVKGEPARLELCALAAKKVLGIALTAALDPWAGAENVGVGVRGRNYINEFPAEIRDQLLIHGSTGWSAVTFKFGDEAMIVLNPNHDRGRQKVTLAEELAHLVMGHPPSALDSVSGIRTYNGEIEGEAYGVGGAMVMPYGQLFALARNAAPAGAIARKFAVSEKFTNYRINRAGLRPMYRKRISAAAR
jgi:Zn-dependent peptidase ImmA (M78 family)